MFQFLVTAAASIQWILFVLVTLRVNTFQLLCCWNNGGQLLAIIIVLALGVSPVYTEIWTDKVRKCCEQSLWAELANHPPGSDISGKSSLWLNISVCRSFCPKEGRKDIFRLVSKDLTRCSVQSGVQRICAGYLSTRTQLHEEGGGYITAAYV